MESRLIDLEIRYAHLERQLAELSQVVFEQQKAVTSLEQQLSATRSRIAGMGEPQPIEKPPHY